ncbi:MAG: hypothetical protein KC417_17455, partial [Myxococcales bacterium]|nr:hypothetical protein [Myxococcales bacterium]
VLTEWTVDEAARIVRGTGTEYDVARRQKGTRPGAMEIRLEDVALFETNEIGTSSAFLALAIVTGVSAALTAFCLTNWKSCFGSCPTFYASDGSEMVLQAEGFSDSVAPSLEATDIDALSRSHPTERNFKLEMTNEALETHVVRSVRILAVPKGAGGTVLRTPKDTFLRATSLRSPSACASETGSCLPRVVAADGDEWFRPANDEDLGRREEVQLEFNVPAPRPGAEPRRHALVLTARQSLLSTFVLYQGLAFMGTEASTWLAALETERASSLKDARSMLDALGGIEVEVRGDDGTWRTVGEARETGPLAVDTHAVPLPEGTDARHVRLRLTQGHWRIDRIALAEVADAAAPVPLTPTRIRGEVSR